ncbi:pecanex-like protein 2 [Pipistrellus kuhlii]|uniref:Pecanex-like protein n=1 Tax=Pipistrellus kuhlii TaxID=59472 RepID=A0A7J7TQC8_PIPKU|nr:pecanex-like protein 2 [Pipistrellus kuhlii]KAF6302583.1 pecanex 2 [Pipistrellus kuhlii]
MGSQVLQLLRQGVWAALTGGWYHDPEHSKFTNSCHLYLWLFLLLLPLALHLALPPSAFAVFLYCSSVALLFAVIKLVSYRLHLMFDKGEAIRRRPSRKRERPSKHREASSEHTPSHKTPSHTQLAGSGKKGECDRNSCTPPLGCGSPGQNSSSHRSSGLPELPAQETAEDLKGVILADDQPVVAPAAPTPPGAPKDSSPPRKASVPGAGTPPAGRPEPGVAGEDGRGRAGGGRGQPRLRHRSEGGLERPPRERPHLSASHSDLQDTGASFQRWGSEDSVTKHDARGRAGERPPRESLSRSWPQCHTGTPQPGGHPLEDPSRRADPPLNLQRDVSEGHLAVTLTAASAPGDPRSPPHEPIRIVITVSSARGSTSDLESSLRLQEGGPPNLEQRIPAITLELPEDRGADQGAPEERWTAEAPGGERGRPGPASLDPSTCRSGQEKRHARVLSMDSGTEVLLSRGPAEGGQEKERAMPTSKSDLEAKEGQAPNDSNFLEFVSLLESISTATVGAGGRRRGPAEPGREGRLPGDHGSQERKSETVERGRRAKQGKPDAQSQEHASPSPARTEPAKVTALFQGHRHRQIIYRVRSQQDSSVLQVISGPETSGPEEMSMDAMHVFIDGHGEIRSCYLKSGTQKDGPAQHQPPSHDGLSPAGDAPVSSSSSSSGSPDPSSGDAALSPLQQQLLLMVAQRTQPASPRHRSQDLEASSCSSAPGKFSRDQFYRFLVFPGKRVKVWYDRLALLALLDRTEDVRENVLAVSLVVLVSLLGFLTLSRGLCKDLWALLFCLVMAGCQYSLLKSVQPDPASPIHGHNQVIAYSRPIYFCVLCGLLLLLDAGAKARHPPAYAKYGLTLCSPESLQSARDFLLGFLYCFPAISLLGLFPQIDTFCVYLLEQIDMLVFGGSAVSGMTSAVCSVARSAAAACALHALCFSAVKEPWSTQHIPALFSAFCGLLVSLCLHLSRQSSDPAVLLSFIRGRWFPRSSPRDPAEPAEDPLPGKMRDSVKAVLRSDLLLCPLAAVLSFAVSASTVFLSLRPFLGLALFAVAGAVGFVTHYLLPQLRKHHPWMWLAHPVLRGREHRQREVTEAAHVMWFERLYLRLQCVEKYALHPAIVLNALTLDAFAISTYRRPGTHWDIFLLIVAGMKLLRASFCHPGRQFAPLGLAVLFFHFDCRGLCDSFLLDFFLASVLCSKLGDLLQKLQFVLAYVAPWQMAWGSSFHVFAQLFAIPHSALLFAQTAATSVLSTPLSPFLGSVLFVTSYVRPVKFWEKDYNTRRVDNSNTRLAVQMERDPASDDNNLNSIFYEHLTRSLQESLCGDLALGRWGNYGSGDCFILASDYLNAFVHLIEVANGLVTFQLRGLEFRGTYCQQREVEAIMEGAEDDGGCCCCRPGHLPHLLSCNAAFHLRWLTWEVTRTHYVLEGYRVLDNNAATMLQVFDLRRALVRFYVQSIVYYLVTSPTLPSWLGSEALRAALQPFAKWHHIERDPGVFHAHIDEDYVPCLQGVTRASFCSVHLEWIQHCARRAQEAPQTLDSDEDSPLVTLAFALCILGRRALGTASHSLALSLDSFLHGLHALFKGDFRLAARDEWVFADMDLLQRVLAPAIRMALKLHQDQFTCPDEYEDPAVLFEAIRAFERTVVICHEGDPAWRGAVLANREELLTLRHVVDDGADEFKVIMLHRSFLSFKVIKVNKECVRGLWAGQQQELIFLRNRNPERGSIQNHRQVLRNLICSSCDQPLGYPMYVSPLTTSYLGSHGQLRGLWCGPVTLHGIRAWLRTKWLRMRKDCHAEQRAGGSIEDGDGAGAPSTGRGSAPSAGGQEQPGREGTHHWSPREGVRNTGRRKGRSQSVQAHGALSPRPPYLSASGPILEGRPAALPTSSSALGLAARPEGSRLSLRGSAASLHSQPPPAAPGPLGVRERAEALVRSSLGSSSSSTLSFLFGKRSFSSALVISGLSAAEGGATSDTQSSSSVNLALGPSARAASQAQRHFSDPCDPAEAAEQAQLRGRPAAGPGVLCRRASQEDMGLDDTASQRSASDEQ